MVTHIWLPYKGLRGSLSESLGNLTYLSHLNLSHNLLFGPLPKGLFSSFIQLKVLDLSYNTLSGNIGDTSGWLDSIQVLDISSNHFHGIISSSFLQRSWRLMTLNVSHNGFNGPIPSFPCINSSFVKFLDFSHNDFKGQIPLGLGVCSKLKVFLAGFNSLFGPIPCDIYYATSLEEISLSSNILSGPISNEIANLTKLSNLELHNNTLSEGLPLSIGKLSKLKYLFLQSNHLIGHLPSSLVNCTNLMTLILQENFLEGNISMYNFSNLRHLTIIDLARNNFSGNLPVSLYFCKSLVAIRLSYNNVEGQIIEEVLQLQFLSFLSLTGNRLTNITGAIRILKHCKSLTVLLLGENFLNEAMPNDDGIVTSNIFPSIQYLDFYSGQLTSQLPKWLSSLKTLRALGLANNFIIGPIPSWLSTLPKLKYLELSNNSLSGEFPKELCMMPSFVLEESLRENSYFALPVFVRKNTSFVQFNSFINTGPALYVGKNCLTGKIPIEIGHLKQLRLLELNDNNFSGHIPYQISELTNLEHLELSSNQLLGEIPEPLTGLHFLSYLNVSYNHLHRQIPLGTQLQSFDASAYMGNPELCGHPLQACANIVKTGEEKYILNDDNKLGMPWFAVCVVIGFIVGFWGVCGPLLFNYKWRVAYYLFFNAVGDWLHFKVMVLFKRS